MNIAATNKSIWELYEENFLDDLWEFWYNDTFLDDDEDIEELGYEVDPILLKGL